jgi:SAM-dependent methyltransferase
MQSDAEARSRIRHTRLAAAFGYCGSDEVTGRALQQDAAGRWDAFYTASQRNFFKDRHWLVREFPLLAREGLLLCELGCGVGNSTFPLLEECPSLRVYCSDFSAAAVQLLRQHPSCDPRRVLGCAVADCSDPAQVAAAVPEACDALLLVFVLSAMPPAAMPGVVAAAKRVLKPGGTVLLRDYGAGDACELRFLETPESRRLGERLYCRGDGTQAYFFTLEALRSVWQEGGFETLQCEERVMKAAATGGHLRRFVQGQFRKPL